MIIIASCGGIVPTVIWIFSCRSRKINTLVRGLKDENGAPLQAGATLIASLR